MMLMLILLVLEHFLMMFVVEVEVVETLNNVVEFVVVVAVVDSLVLP